MKVSRSEQLISYAILVVMALGIAVPLASIVLAALQPSGTLLAGMSWPKQWSWGNFQAAWTQGDFGSLMWQSLKVELVVVPLTLLLAALAGYGLGAMRTPLRSVFNLLFLLGMTLPIEVVIVPLYFDLRTLGLTDSWVTVSLVESAAFVPFGVYWMRTHFQSLPRELVESAQMDGAGAWVQFWHIQLPLARSALTTLGVLYFMWSWNQFLLVVTIMSDPNSRTAPAGLGFFIGPHSMNIPLLSAATLIVVMPIVVVYLIFQRRFVAGLLAGAVK